MSSIGGGRWLTEGDPDELIQCPFDPVHLLRRKRMPYHIIKCGKNFDKKDFQVCPFNYRHIVPSAEWQSHLSQCVDRGIVEREMIHNEDVSSGVVHVQKGYTDLPVSTFVPPDSEESWDDSNVVVSIGQQHHGLHSNEDEDEDPISEGEAVSRIREAALIRDPPRPRNPVMTGALGSEVFNFTKSRSNTRPPGISRGRGRGREVSVTLPNVGMSSESEATPQLVHLPSTHGSVSGYSSHSPPSSIEQGSDGAVDKLSEDKKKERKLRKMLRQILDLEDKQKKGYPLDPEMMAKISRKDDVISRLKLQHMYNTAQ